MRLWLKNHPSWLCCTAAHLHPSLQGNLFSSSLFHVLLVISIMLNNVGLTRFLISNFRQYLLTLQLERWAFSSFTSLPTLPPSIWLCYLLLLLFSLVIRGNIPLSLLLVTLFRILISFCGSDTSTSYLLSAMLLLYIIIADILCIIRILSCTYDLSSVV